MPGNTLHATQPSYFALMSMIVMETDNTLNFLRANLLPTPLPNLKFKIPNY